MENVNIKSGDYQQINRTEKPKTVKISKFANLKNRIQKYWLSKQLDRIEKKEASLESDMDYYSRSLTESQNSKKILSNEKATVNAKLAILDEEFNKPIKQKASKPIRIAATALYNITNFLQKKATSLYSKTVMNDQDFESVVAKAGREPAQIAPTRTNSDGFKEIERLVDASTKFKGNDDRPDLSFPKSVNATDNRKKNDPISFGKTPVVKVDGAEEWNKLVDQAIDVNIPKSDVPRQKPMKAQNPIKNSTKDETKPTKSTTDSFYDKHGFYQNSASYFDSKFGSKIEKPIKVEKPTNVDKDTIDKQIQINNEIEEAIKKQEENIQKQKAEYENKMAAILKAAQAKEEARKTSLMQQQKDLSKRAEAEKEQQDKALADMMAEYGIKPEDLEESKKKTR